MDDDKFSVNSDDESTTSSVYSDVGGARKKKPVKKAIVEDFDASDVESEIGMDSDVESEVDSEVEDDGDDLPLPTHGDVENFPSLESDDEEEEDEDYLQKLDEDVTQNILQDHHPELLVNNYEEIEAMCRIVRDENNNIIDPLHKTLPYVTRYEKARILGERAKQLNAGAGAFVEVDPDIIDGELIALREFEAKKIPFIVQRPMPNGGCEYWKLKDLEIL